MVVTETSKVHNDYEFTSKKIHYHILRTNVGYKNMNLSLLSIW